MNKIYSGLFFTTPNKEAFSNYVYMKRWVGSPKISIFVNVHNVENVTAGGYVVNKGQKLVNVVCEHPTVVHGA